MDMYSQTKELRRTNLRKLAKEYGSINLLAKRLHRAPSQLSHLIGSNATKLIGDQLAHKIEHKLGLPAGWLDQAHQDNESNKAIEKARLADLFTITSNVPLLVEHEILPWLQKPNPASLQRSVTFIKTCLLLSQYAFAVEVTNDFMEAPSGISIPRGSIVIVDTEMPLKNNDYIIVCPDKSVGPQIRQFVLEGSHKYLKPLNPCYPITELTTPHYIVCGILCQVIILLHTPNPLVPNPAP